MRSTLMASSATLTLKNFPVVAPYLEQITRREQKFASPVFVSHISPVSIVRRVRIGEIRPLLL